MTVIRSVRGDRIILEKISLDSSYYSILPVKSILFQENKAPMSTWKYDRFQLTQTTQCNISLTRAIYKTAKISIQIAKVGQGMSWHENGKVEWGYRNNSKKVLIITQHSIKDGILPDW